MQMMEEAYRPLQRGNTFPPLKDMLMVERTLLLLRHLVSLRARLQVHEQPALV